MASTPAKCLLVMLTASVLLSCGMMARPGQEFAAAGRDYALRLRWMDFSAAAAYLSEEHREDFLNRFKSLPDLHVVDARLESVDYRQEERRGETTTVLEYYLLPSATVKAFRLRQEWVYAGDDRYHAGTWRITTPFPAFPSPGKTGG